MEGTSYQALNFDKLVSVTPWIRSRRDVLSYISTCATLYRAGISILLGFHYRITSARLASFRECLISKQPSSFLGLKSLEFWLDGKPESSASESSALIHLFTRAKRLRHVSIHGSITHQNLNPYQYLAESSTLESLYLADCDDAVDHRIVLLSRLRSPLTWLKIQFSGKSVDVVELLSNFRHTLTKATISQAALFHATPGCINYTNLTSLELEDVSQTRLSILVPAFPSLRDLKIDIAYRSRRELHQLRADNWQYQQDHLNPAWHLSSLTGNAASLYTLALEERVPTVVVTSVSLTTLDHGDRLHAALSLLRPLVLSIDDDSEPIYSIDWLSSVMAGASRELVSLDVHVVFGDPEPTCSHEEQLDILFNELSLASVTKPWLFFLCIRLSDEPPEFTWSHNLAYDFINSLDIPSLATRAELAVPTVKFVKLIIQRRRQGTRTVSYWLRREGKLGVVPSTSHTLVNNAVDEMMSYGASDASSINNAVGLPEQLQALYNCKTLDMIRMPCDTLDPPLESAFPTFASLLATRH
ncbi:hypothetical protein EIP86_008162 [Pleurotus ostreatoroseus]|nr:hypothetical protein EIP86_008162 [Pleurotus ostreatoroseus]